MGNRASHESESVPGAGVGDECEAFVSGRWAEYLEAGGWPVPGWAWLNRVVHARPDELRAVAGSQGHVLDESSEASTFLAGELLDAADSLAGDVGGLQRDVLVPFELGLFADADVRSLTPGQLLARVLSLLPRPVNG